MTTFRPTRSSSLTTREREVIALMALGYSNARICTALGMAPELLEDHLERVFWKLDALPAPGYHRRVGAVLAWVGAGDEADVTEASGLSGTWR